MFGDSSPLAQIADPVTLQAGSPLAALAPCDLVVRASWRARYLPHLRDLFALIGPEERARAHALRDDGRRAAYIAGHGLARLVLSSLAGSGLGPETWRFRDGPRGRPVLHPRCGLGFSLSYSGSALIVAAARGHSIGLDMEEMSGAGPGAVPWFALTDEERELVREAGSEQARLATFLRIWTVKEAFGKCFGVGLPDPARVGVGLAPLRAARSGRSDARVLLHQETVRLDGRDHVVALAAFPRRARAEDLWKTALPRRADEPADPAYA